MARAFTVSVFLLTAGATEAAEPVKDARESGVDAGEVEALREEVELLRRAMEDLLEIDRQRVEALAKALEQKDRPTGRDRRPPASALSKPTPTATTPATTGNIVGKVDAPTNVAYVFVEDLPGQIVRGRKVVIEQVDKQYKPRWAVVRKGTEVEFPNRDAVYHNVFSKSAGNAFDLGIYRAGDESKSVVLTTPGVVDVFCNMHPQMSASVLVVPNGYYARVKSDGSFRLNVPNGRRRVTAWAPFAETKTEVVVVEGKDVSVTFKLGPRRMNHLNKHGQSYGSYE